MNQDEYYWDDPVDEYEESAGSRRKIPTAILLIISLVLTGFFVRSTFASNITMSTSSFEFGQGMALTAACAGSNNIILTPGNVFSNASNGCSFKIDTLTISNIPQSCYGKDFIFSLYPDSSNTPATLFYGTTSITLYDNSGTFSTLASAANYVTLASSATTCIGGVVNSAIYGGQGAGFMASRYVASSEYSASNGWTHNFNFAGGQSGAYAKSYASNYVRPIRAY